MATDLPDDDRATDGPNPDGSASSAGSGVEGAPVFQLADFGRRLFGRVIDTALVGGLGFLVFAIALVAGQPSTVMDSAGRPSDAFVQATGLAAILGAAVGLALGAFLTFRQGRSGQTPGMQVAKLKLVREYDAGPDLRTAYVRWGAETVLWFGVVLSSFLLLPLAIVVYAWPIFDTTKRQTLVDKAVKMVVIEAR